MASIVEPFSEVLQCAHGFFFCLNIEGECKERAFFDDSLCLCLCGNGLVVVHEVVWLLLDCGKVIIKCQKRAATVLKISVVAGWDMAWWVKNML